MFIAALFAIVRTWKQPRCPSTEEWIKKMWHIYAWLGQTEEPLAVAPGFIFTVFTGFGGTYSLWTDTLVSLDIVGRALNLSQSNVPYPL